MKLSLTSVSETVADVQQALPVRFLCDFGSECTVALLRHDLAQQPWRRHPR